MALKELEQKVTQARENNEMLRLDKVLLKCFSVKIKTYAYFVLVIGFPARQTARNARTYSTNLSDRVSIKLEHTFFVNVIAQLID